MASKSARSGGAGNGAEKKPLSRLERAPGRSAGRKRDKAVGAAMPPFSHSLPMQLMRAREQVMQRFRAHLRAHGLTDQQWRVIRALVEVDSLEIVDLSARCVIHPASLSRILPKLQARRLITRRTNEIDQRRTIVSIAPAGRELFATLVPESQAIYKQIERELGIRRLKVIYAMLGELIAILSTNAAVAEFED